MKYDALSRELFDPVRESIRGTVPIIENPIERLRNVFNFIPAQYILLGSITGAGKTSYIDHSILGILEDIPENIHFEVLYYSMERKKKFKFAKFISWKMFRTEHRKVSAKRIVNSDNQLKENQLDYIQNNYHRWANDVLEYVDVRDGVKTVKQIRQDIDALAKRLGVFYHSDDDHIYKFDKLIKPFNPQNFVKTKYGNKLYEEITVAGKKYTLFQNDRLFLTAKPILVLIVIDHIGKVKSDGNKKATLDELDAVLSDARDKYSFSPIAISQFNRGVSNIDRLKYSAGELDPVLEDFKDTGNLTESADIVMSLFDPARYKSWNSEGEYKGVNIRDATVTPTGIQRARSLHIIKNSFGADKQSLMLRFTGESGYFEPFPKMHGDLEKVYADIMQGN